MQPDLSKILLCSFLGGLFDLSESKQEVAFRYAVERVNANRKILPKSLLSAQIEKIPPQDSFHASKRGKKKSHSSILCDAESQYRTAPNKHRTYHTVQFLELSIDALLYKLRTG